MYLYIFTLYIFVDTKVRFISSFTDEERHKENKYHLWCEEGSCVKGTISAHCTMV